jgi:hypothetical protein
MISGARLGLAEEDVLGDPLCMALSLHEPSTLCKDKVAPATPQPTASDKVAANRSIPKV